MLGRDRQPDRIGRERLTIKARVVRSLVRGIVLRDDEVEVAQPRLAEGRLGLALHELDPHVGRDRAHRLECGGHEGEHRRLEDGCAHRADDILPRRVQLCLGELHDIEQIRRARDEAFRRGRQPQTAPRLAQQLDPRFALELREVLRDRRWAVRRGLCNGGDRSAQVKFAEEAQLLEVQHPEPPIMKDH